MSFRIGIIGGMGPLAGVLLQRLIIEATPATKDQDHIQVVCFTNPKIPDRTLSLQKDGGASFLKGLIESGKLLADSGVDMIAIPCNTAHAKAEALQKYLSCPVINMISLSAEYIARNFPEVKRIGILATDGTLATELYQEALAEHG